jgi:hypothetical protein
VSDRIHNGWIAGGGGGRLVRDNRHMRTAALVDIVAGTRNWKEDNAVAGDNPEGPNTADSRTFLERGSRGEDGDNIG